MENGTSPEGGREQKPMTDIGIIDVHSHMLFPCYQEGLKEMGIDPVKEDGFPTPQWSAQEHLAWMEDVGIETSILSLSTPTSITETGTSQLFRLP